MGRLDFHLLYIFRVIDSFAQYFFLDGRFDKYFDEFSI